MREPTPGAEYGAGKIHRDHPSTIGCQRGDDVAPQQAVGRYPVNEDGDTGPPVLRRSRRRLLRERDQLRAHQIRPLVDDEVT
jgi:hypothetical protein